MLWRPPGLLIVTFSWCLSTFDRHPRPIFRSTNSCNPNEVGRVRLPKFPEIADTISRCSMTWNVAFETTAGRFNRSWQGRSVALQTGDIEGRRAFHKQLPNAARFQ